MLKVPRLVFCTAPDAFSANASWDDLATAEGYGSVIRPPEVAFRGAAQYEEQYQGVEHRWEDVDTVFNGRCRMFVTEERLLNTNYLIFAVYTEAVDIYVLDKGGDGSGPSLFT